MTLYLFVFAFGAVIGSFLNVCIYRIPRDESVIFPSSRCPSCRALIRPWDNIPVLSYLFLGGRCRQCKAVISPRYPVVELINAVLYVGLLWRYGPGTHFFVYALLTSALIVVTFIDFDHQIIPDRITLPGILLGLLAGSFVLQDPFLRGTSLGYKSSVSGFLAGGGFFYLVAVFSRGGMGGGDIKLMAMLGSFLGWKSVLLTTFLGSLTGSIVGLFLIVFRGKGRKTKVPFGPFLSLGAVVTIFFAQEIWSWYMSLR